MNARNLSTQIAASHGALVAQYLGDAIDVIASNDFTPWQSTNLVSANVRAAAEHARLAWKFAETATLPVFVSQVPIRAYHNRASLRFDLYRVATYGGDRSGTIVRGSRNVSVNGGAL